MTAEVAQGVASGVASGVAWTVTSRVTLIMTLEVTQEAGGESQFQTRDSGPKCLFCSIYRVVGGLWAGQT